MSQQAGWHGIAIPLSSSGQMQHADDILSDMEQLHSDVRRCRFVMYILETLYGMLTPCWTGNNKVLDVHSDLIF